MVVVDCLALYEELDGLLYISQTSIAQTHDVQNALRAVIDCPVIWRLTRGSCDTPAVLTADEARSSKLCRAYGQVVASTGFAPRTRRDETRSDLSLHSDLVQ